MDAVRARGILAGVILISLVSTAGIALPYPILSPLFLTGEPTPLTNYLGLPPKLLLGILLALYPLGMLVGGSIIGALSDRYGRRRTLSITLGLAALGYVATALAVVQESFPLFALARLVTGFCEGNIAVARAVALDLHPHVSRERAMALVYAASYAGWLIGPLTGGYLAPLGIDTVFYVAATAMALSMVVIVVVLPRDRVAAGAGAAPPKRLWDAMREDNSVHLLREPAIARMMGYHFLFTLGLNTFYEMYPLWLVEAQGQGSLEIAWTTVVVTAFMIGTSALVVTPVARSIGGERVVVWFTVLLGLLLLMSPLIEGVGLYVGFACVGVAIAFVNGAFPSLMSARFGERGEGRVMGLLVTSFCLANVLMALGGSLLAMLNIHWPMLLAGVLCLLAAGWFVWVQKHAAGAAVE
ncbi:MFS transporter [Biformimicrobium ophioploci]|uniref:Tetracycline resistance MFS efflux pump n=1 Tax=Biformimicrobium ophioploci TaxID=3036711 RepID=A0ABQ6LYF3_9GAMM|nr:MFS transporter [Microbulbifer sp. NKW57]GMG87118.1 tetracycline resistance MFS efflux pump [Microbulbifer sp. NKW57]